MSDFDVIVVGGSFAGLSAALQLGRARRKVLILDSGENRNRVAAESHGLIGFDGRSPADILRSARADVDSYPTVERHHARAAATHANATGFDVSTDDGETFVARKLILTTGVTDTLPEIPGLSDLWGSLVFHCPYCHGYEFRDQTIASIIPVEALGHMRMLLDWSADVTVLTNGESAGDADPGGLAIDDRGIERIERIDRGARIHFVNGKPCEVAGIHVGTRTAPAGGLHHQLGCTLAESPAGPRLSVSDRFETSVPGVFAAGDVITPMNNLANTIGSGAMAGVMAHASLLFDPA